MAEEVREQLEAAKLSDDPVAPPAPFDEVDAIIQTYVDTAAVPGDEERANRSREAMIRTIITTFVDEQGLRGKVARKEVTGAECHEMIRDHIIAFLSASQGMPPAEPDASLRVAWGEGVEAGDPPPFAQRVSPCPEPLWCLRPSESCYQSLDVRSSSVGAVGDCGNKLGGGDCRA